MYWKLEIVYAIFGKRYFSDHDEPPTNIELEFPLLHVATVSRFYCVLHTRLDGPLTIEQEGLLDYAKADGNILDYCARQVVSSPT
jgi:hypothetical protein